VQDGIIGRGNENVKLFEMRRIKSVLGGKWYTRSRLFAMRRIDLVLGGD